MAISRKPYYDQKKVNLTDAIISKGGSSPSEQLSKENDNIKLTLRLPSRMLCIIDDYLEKCISNKTRTYWIREAIEEKMKKEIINQ